MAKYYIAYGSNMNASQMRYRCPKSKFVENKLISGWQLTFRRHGSGYANIEKSERGRVPVVVYQITDNCEKALDRYEGVPVYYVKKYVKIDIGGKKVKALTYVMNKVYQDEIYPPRRDYFERIRVGYEQRNLKIDYLYSALDATIKEFYYIP